MKIVIKDLPLSEEMNSNYMAAIQGGGDLPEYGTLLGLIAIQAIDIVLKSL